MADQVLIIEFDGLIRSLLTEWLAGLGVAVVAQAVVDPLPELHPSLVMIGLLGPLRHPIAAVAKVRQRYPGVPVLGLSTHASESVAGDSRTALSLGLDMLLPIPCTRVALTAAVRTLTARR